MSAFLLWSLTLHAQTAWECQGILRPGDYQQSFRLYLDPAAKNARIVLPSASYEVFPITSQRQQHYFYDLLPGVQDERVETRRMFRFGEERDLVYIDNDAGIFLLGHCENE